MTRKLLVLGLMVLAALLPLAPPVSIFILEVPLAVAGDAPRVAAHAQPAAFVALTASRAPPSR